MSDGPGLFEKVYDAHVLGVYRFIYARVGNHPDACHDASFDLAGRLANGRAAWRADGAYRGDARAYPVELPDLVRPRINVEDGVIFVWTAQA